MDFQTAFNAVLGLLYALIGWLLNNLYQSIRELGNADRMLASKVQEMEVLVAGNYVKRSEFDRKMDALFRKLDDIESKIDRKMERVNGAQ